MLDLCLFIGRVGDGGGGGGEGADDIRGGCVVVEVMFSFSQTGSRCSGHM